MPRRTQLNGFNPFDPPSQKAMRKKVDSRVRVLVENGVKERKRTLFVLVGDRGRDQVRLFVAAVLASCVCYSRAFSAFF